MTNPHKDGAIWQRITDNSGETIAETLVSVLISALALLLMATAIGTSVNIIMSTRNHMENYYEAEATMINGTGGGESSSVTAYTIDEPACDVPIWQTNSGGYSNTVSVQLYTSTETDVTLYNKIVTDGGV